jgi:putative flippase GtrA
VTHSLDAHLLFRSRYGRIGRLFLDLMKYGAASAFALALDVATLLVLNKLLGVHYLVAAAAGFSAGLVLIYVLSVRYVFNDSRVLRPSQEAVGFLVTGLSGLLINHVLMHVFVEDVGLAVALAKIPTAGIVFLFNFTTRRALFSRKARPRPTGGEPRP